MNVFKIKWTILVLTNIVFYQVCFSNFIGNSSEATCWPESNSLACNNGLALSLNTACEAPIFPDMILEGTYPNYDDFEVVLKINGQTLPSSPVANGNHIGQVIDVKVIEISSGNQCWSSITVQDKIGPQIDCGSTHILTCLNDPDQVNLPLATDACDSNPTIIFVQEQKQLDNCGTSIITRTYRAIDFYGNISGTCDQIIEIGQATPTFPEDVTWTCEQFALFPNIISATSLHECLNNPMLDAEDDFPGKDAFSSWTDGEDLDVPLNPSFDDTFDNPLTDLLPNVLENLSTPIIGDPIFNTLNTPTAETDNQTAVCNLSINYEPAFLTFIDSSQHIHDTIQIVNYPTGPNANTQIEGLEDADILQLTGSGIPNVKGTDCPYNVTYSDEKIEACPGVDKTNTFKILRTWTLLNDCTNEIIQDIQIIKVEDKTPPTIIFQNFDNELVSNQYVNGSNPVCAAEGRLDIPLVFDQCSGINMIRVFTSVGEGLPILDANGNLIGFDIPSPYLERGYHDVTYSASDNCGNVRDTTIQIKVIDGIPPVAICREFTVVSLNNGVTTTLPADNFDVASRDNCGRVYFKIKRLEPCSGYESDEDYFNDRINFCCTDIGDTVDVVVRVYDVNPGAGMVELDTLLPHANECEVHVIIYDNVRPKCIAPADVWTSCDLIPDNLDYSDSTVLNQNFGFPIATDNCEASIRELAPTVVLDNCGVGRITRNFKSDDIHGNTSLGNCRQQIMVQSKIDYEISFPDDYSIDCTAPTPDTLAFAENGCDILAINKEDLEFFATNDGSCRTIFRTFRIVNWCEYDGVSQPTILARQDLNNDGLFDGFFLTSDGNLLYRDGNVSQISTGFYEYTQHIKVFDSHAPDLTAPSNLEFCGGELDEVNCSGMVRLMPEVMEFCTPDAISVRWKLDLFSDGTFDLTGNDSLIGRHPLGVHAVEFNVSDDCGNTSRINFTFEIIDCKAPTPVCHSGLSIDLSGNGIAALWASDFNASSYDYCNPIKFGLNRITDTNGDGFITEDDHVSSPPIFDSIQFTCASSGMLEFVQLWVGEVSSDNQNNWDYCTTWVEIQDNFNNCSGSKSKLSGVIEMENGRTVSKVQMALSGDLTQMMMTTNDGHYQFDNLTLGDDFTVTPMRDDVHNVGISTFDLILVQKHVLNVQLLNSPYKIIAADANLSNSVSTLDVVALRKMVLRVADKFPNGNTAWRFVSKNHIFNNPLNPWQTPFPEAINYNNLTNEVLDADFIAIKVGDVTLDVNPNNINLIEDRKFKGAFTLKAKNQIFKKGEIIEIPITTNEVGEIAGLQFGFYFEKEIFEFIKIEYGLLTKNNFGFNSVTDGFIQTSWINPELSGEAILFTLVLKPKSNGELENHFSISEEKLLAEAYGLEDEYLNVNLEFSNEKVLEFSATPNFPNPFSTETHIEIELPSAAEVQLKIFDTKGKYITQITNTYTKGKSTITIPADVLPANGLFLYQLIWGNQTHVGRMIKF